MSASYTRARVYVRWEDVQRLARCLFVSGWSIQDILSEAIDLFMEKHHISSEI